MSGSTASIWSRLEQAPIAAKVLAATVCVALISALLLLTIANSRDEPAVEAELALPTTGPSFSDPLELAGSPTPSPGTSGESTSTATSPSPSASATSTASNGATPGRTSTAARSGPTGTGTGTGTKPVTAAPVPPLRNSGTAFGMSVKPNPGENWEQAVRRLERQVGPFEMVRKFFTTPKSLDSVTKTTKADIAVSFKLDPAAVVRGQHDALLNNWFAGLPKDRRIWWTYYHEPENNSDINPTTYRAAWNHIIKISHRHETGDRIQSSLILMSYSLKKGSGRNWKDYYPGPAVDIVGWDAYSRIGRGTYQSPQELYGPVLAASRSVGKPFGIGETASGLLPDDKDGTGRAAWMRQIGRWLADNNAVYASYFNSDIGNGTDYRLHDQAGRAAWKDVLRY